MKKKTLGRDWKAHIGTYRRVHPGWEDEGFREGIATLLEKSFYRLKKKIYKFQA